MELCSKILYQRNTKRKTERKKDFESRNRGLLRGKRRILREGTLKTKFEILRGFF